MSGRRKHPHQKSQEVRIEALAAVEAGVSHREVARISGVSAPTIGRWVKLAAEELQGSDDEQELPAAPVEMPVDDDPPIQVEGTLLERTEQLQGSQLALAASAQKVGNHTAAQKSFRDAAGLSTVLARLEKASGANIDQITVPRKEVEDLMNGVVERIKTLAARPLLCAGCSCKLSIHYGTGGKIKGTKG